MKTLTPSAFVAVCSVLLPSLSQASLIIAPIAVGLHNFNDPSRTSETILPGSAANYAQSGFSGVATFPGKSATGGSSDNFYGPDSAPVGIPVVRNSPLQRPVSNDGFIFMGTSTIFSVTNTASSQSSLAALLFDASRDGASPITVDYKKLTDPTWSSAQTFTPVTSPVSFGSFNMSDFAIDLSAISLAIGQTIQFRFQSATGGRLDNIALTAIPETASVLALSLLIGGGLLMRNRRGISAPTFA